MNKQEKEAYLEKYKEEKEKGVPFFPDIIFKDAIVTLLIFGLLIAFATFLGAPLEARANPNDASYTPRPEWYFLFLFQLLKYFPGNLEVVGAMILPTLFILLLIVLPFIDRSPKRHYLSRPLASLTAVVVVVGIVGLTGLAEYEAPPPVDAVVVDKAADLYSKNCANCHGQKITVPPGTDLHKLIFAGNHQGMPAWGGDLSTDEIDMLVGFVLSPNGSDLFTEECASCHKNSVLASGNAVELQKVFDQGQSYPPHKGLNTPDWKASLGADGQNALLNFLAAPDGQRLFVINCSGCHGQGVGFNGSEDQLRGLIIKGLHEKKMPGWKGTLSSVNMSQLADYVVKPQSSVAGEKLFGQYCIFCHGDRIPTALDKDTALEIIEKGGSHVTMPEWGKILTQEQIDALTSYTWESSQGAGVTAGEKLFASNCRGCHGKFGEGGPNPSFPGDMILPISSSEYLKTRDDATIRNIITQGQPNYGMIPFGATNGGSLNDQQIDAIVAYIRSWQANPPATTPPKAPPAVFQPRALTSRELYDGMCAQCHGADFGGTNSAPPLDAAELRRKYDDQALFTIINDGVLKVAMPGVGHMFSADQVQQLVTLIAGESTGQASSSSSGSIMVSFSEQVLPILQARCVMCHNTQATYGGWDSSTYQSVITTGTKSSAIIPGDAENSPLVQLLEATNGVLMPPTGALSDEEMQIIKDWINAGALDN